MTQVGIIGYGFVGKAVAQLRQEYEVYIYDPFVKKYSSQEHYKNAYNADVVFVCVPTPSSEDGSLDISIVEEVAHNWSQTPRPETAVLVIKSTIPPGTVDKLCDQVGSTNIVHNPEFLTERTACQDFMNAQEIIAGGHQKACEAVIGLYRGFYGNDMLGRSYRITDAKTAELLKLTRNSFYATKISFMNEIYQLCQALQVDYDDFRMIFTNNGHHPWVAAQHTRVPGPDGQLSWGGRCFVKDTAGLAAAADDLNVDLILLKTAIKQREAVRDH